jgi:hypothetical protein
MRLKVKGNLRVVTASTVSWVQFSLFYQSLDHWCGKRWKWEANK